MYLLLYGFRTGTPSLPDLGRHDSTRHHVVSCVIENGRLRDSDSSQNIAVNIHRVFVLLFVYFVSYFYLILSDLWLSNVFEFLSEFGTLGFPIMISLVSNVPDCKHECSHIARIYCCCVWCW